MGKHRNSSGVQAKRNQLISQWDSEQVLPQKK